jgi:hypothetical protein
MKLNSKKMTSELRSIIEIQKIVDNFALRAYDLRVDLEELSGEIQCRINDLVDSKKPLR